MSRNRWLPGLLVVAIACGGAGPVTCPPLIKDAAGPHRLDNASLFDGPPNQMADLEPVSAGVLDRWNLDGVDPYLVCKFAGTTRMVTLHAAGAKECDAGGSPFRAYCRG